MSAYAFGIDIGGTTIKIGFFNGEGVLLKKWEIPTRKEQNGIRILPDIAEALKKELEEREVDFSRVSGIGLGVPGAVISETRVNKCPNLGWGILDVAKELAGLIGVKNIKAANDANAAALGELWQGGAKGYENMVMVTLGTGVGGGVVLGGKIIPGAFGAAGEIGHLMMSKRETTPCGCGKKGHLEQYASAPGIARKAGEVLAATDRPSLLRDIPDISAKEVFDAAKAGDQLALEVVEYAGEMLGMALSYISCIIDPEIYILGGGLSAAGSILTDTVRKYFRQYAFHASERAAIELASLGNDAGIYGAVKLVL